MKTYFDYCISHPEDIFNKPYHDTQYGFPIDSDNVLFERLALEINQAGLSWITILKKAGNFHQAYDGFDIDTVAGYEESDRARRIQQSRPEFGSFKGWLDGSHPLAIEEWTRLFKNTFMPISEL
jgi:DNA-3-methyladenine glycosylase I